MRDTRRLLRILVASQTTVVGCLRYLTICCLFMGSTLVLAAPSFGQVEDPVVFGEWHGPFTSPGVIPERSVHSVLTHTGWVVTWSTYGDPEDPGNEPKMHAWKADTTLAFDDPGRVIDFFIPPDHTQWVGTCTPNPINQCTWDVGNSRTNIFCSGHTFLSTGNLFVAGGGAPDNVGCSRIHGAVYMLEVAQIGVSATPWTLVSAVMNRGYYYPTVKLDVDENIIALGGRGCESALGERRNLTHEFFDGTSWIDILPPLVPADSMDTHFGATYPLVNILTWPSPASGDVSVIGRGLHPPTGVGIHKRLSKTGANYDTWTDFAPWPTPHAGANFVTATGTALMYHAPGLPAPVHPNGSVIVFGASSTDENGNIVRMWEPPPFDQWLHSEQQPIAPLDPTHFPRNVGDCVYLPNGKILAVGGGLVANPNVACAGPPCASVSPWCDGTVDGMESIGIECASLRPEMYDPDTGTSQIMAKGVGSRFYHSEALLLPDGRVFVTGGEFNFCVSDGMGGCTESDNDHNENYEIFSPPYIYDPNPRLQITSAPPDFRYGNRATFTVEGAFTESELKVILIKPGSVTHSTNFDQRVVRLNVACVTAVDTTSSCVEVEVPFKDTNLLPPGYYMLWVSKNDVPCVRAKFVNVKDGTASSGTCSGCTATGIPTLRFANRLEQNYPNPFNPSTTIHYSIEERSLVTLRIFNVAGQLVRTLTNEVQEPGEAGHVVTWDGTNDRGRALPRGFYFYQLVALNF